MDEDAGEGFEVAETVEAADATAEAEAAEAANAVEDADDRSSEESVYGGGPVSVSGTDSVRSRPSELKRSLDRFAFVTGVTIRASAVGQYRICGDAGIPFLHAQLRSPSRGCRCGSGGGGGGGAGGASGGPFTMAVSDFSSRLAVMRILCDSYGRVTMESPPSEVIGYVTVERILCSLRFTLCDISGNPQLLVKGPRYCQADSQQGPWFRILLPDESEEVATLGKILGPVQLGEPGIYTVSMPEDMSADLKAMLIGVTLLFDRKMFA